MYDVGRTYDRLAPFYVATMEGFDADIGMYAEFARRLDAPVLELGVGTGRVAIELARGGLQVTGVDLSRTMLQIARKRAAAEGVESLALACDDMRNPAVGGSYGLIFCAIDTFLHLGGTDEQLRVLAAARERLKPEGLLVLDLPGPAGDWGDWNGGAHPFVLDWSREIGDRRLTRFHSFSADLAGQTRHVTEIYEETFPDGTSRRYIVESALRWVFPAEMELLLRLSGLRLHDRYGDYELSPFGSDSERMVVVCGRSAHVRP